MELALRINFFNFNNLLNNINHSSADKAKVNNPDSQNHAVHQNQEAKEIVANNKVNQGSSENKHPHVLEHDHHHIGDGVEPQRNRLNLSNIKFNEISNVQKKMLLRDLMNLPKEWKDLIINLLIKQAETGDKNLSVRNLQQNLQSKHLPVNSQEMQGVEEFSQEELIQNLIKNNPTKQPQKVLLSQMQSLLESSSKDVINKLLRLTQAGNGTNQSFEQLKEVMAHLNKLIPAENTPANQIMKDLLLLYLPYLQLHNPKEFELELMQDKVPADNSDNLGITIFIATEVLDRVRISIYTSAEGGLDIELESNKPITTENMQELQKVLSENISSSMMQATLTIFMQIDDGENKDTLPIEPEKERSVNSNQVYIRAENGVSSAIMLAAHVMVKTILDFDGKLSLLNLRQKRATN